MIAILQFIIITAIAAAFARRVLGERAPEFESAGERLVFESAIGLGLLGLMIFALGILQLFYLPCFLGLLLVMAIVGWRALSGVIGDAVGGLRAIRRTKLQPETLIVGVILAAIGFFALVRSLAPPIADDWDSLAYHLAIPKLFLNHHGIYYIDFSSHSNFPFTWEMLYTLGLAFGSLSLAKLFHFGAGALLIGGVYCLGKRHFSAEVGRLAALIIAGVPLIAWEATTAYVDLTAALYSLLVVYALLNYLSLKDRRWAVMAGLLAGMAAGTKMTALVMIAVAVVWILWSKKPQLKTALAVVFLALVIAAPWYIKSFVYTGNPVYPFAYGVLGGRNWSADTAKLYREDQLKFGMGRDANAFIMLPWNLTFRFTRFNDYGARLPEGDELPLFSGNTQAYLSSVGPIFLVALPIALIASLRRGKHRPLLAVAFGLTAVWFVTMQNTRYLLPMLAILAPAVAYSAELVKARKVVFVLAAVTCAFTILLMALFTLPAFRVSFGLQKPGDYLSERFDLYNASEFVNENLPKDAKIALFGETRGFYLDRDYIWADPGHNALIPYDKMDSGPDQLIEWLESHGIHYILVNHTNIPNEDTTLVGKVIQDGADELYAVSPDPTRGIGVYQISH